MRLSFRDPDGFVFRSGERVFRCVSPQAAAKTRAFISSPAAVSWTNDGILAHSRIVETTAELPEDILTEIPEGSLLLEHPAVRFPNYPYEWAPEMLHAAASRTLDLAQAAMAADYLLNAGYVLKDATPFNIMFEGHQAVFLDVLSFDFRAPLDAVWRPYAQFVRTFLYPLLANRLLGLRIDEIVLAHREGLEPDRMWRMFPSWRLCVPPVLGLVTIPVLLSKPLFSQNAARGQPSKFRPRRARDAQEAKFLLNRLFNHARKILQSLRPKPARNAYDSEHTYTESALKEKEQFVSLAVERCRTVLDAGCNSGRYSLIAASLGSSVVAVDRDPGAVGALWKRAHEKRLDILPLVIDITQPSGASGWENRENASFLDRALGRFDCVLMLALVHHLVVNARAPLDAIFKLAARLTTRLVVIEYVDPADSQFQLLLRGREELHRGLNQDVFEAAARRHFSIASSCQLSSTRTLYSLEKRNH